MTDTEETQMTENHSLTNLERWALIVAIRSLRSGRSAITEARARRRGKRRVVVTTGVEVVS